MRMRRRWAQRHDLVPTAWHERPEKRMRLRSGRCREASGPCVAARASRPRIATHCVCCGGADIQSSPAILMPFVAHRAFGWYPVEIDESWGCTRFVRGWPIRSASRCTAPRAGSFLDIRFSDEELANLYHDYRGPAYNALREQYEPGYTSRNDALNAGSLYIEQCEAFLVLFLEFPLSLLDWGGDTGRNTPFRGNATFSTSTTSARSR